MNTYQNHTSMDIKMATVKDIKILIPALLELRPNLIVDEIEDEFLKLQEESFRIIYIGDENEVYSILGFRKINFFFSGKTLYIDDLVTLPQHRGHGYAGMLLDWVKEYAKSNNYDHISLDSGFQRRDAYRLYLNKEFSVESLHFGRPVKELS